MTVVVTSVAYTRAETWWRRWAMAYDRFGTRFVHLAMAGDKEGAHRMHRRAEQARCRLTVAFERVRSLAEALEDAEKVGIDWYGEDAPPSSEAS